LISATFSDLERPSVTSKILVHQANGR